LRKKTYVEPICVSCTFEIATKTLDLSLEQLNLSKERKNEIKFDAIKKILKILEKEFSEYSYPFRLSFKVYEMIKELTGIKDPYNHLKEYSNEICLNLEDFIWNEINKSKNFKEKLSIAILASITGNIIDFGTAGLELNLGVIPIKEKFKQIKTQGLKINHLDILIEKLEKHKKCLYILDNAGEIVFDKLVMRLFKGHGIKTIAVVKSGPITNDATLEDAKMVNLNEYADKILTTGSNSYGIDPDAVDAKFLENLINEPVIIAKGQANLETFLSLFNEIKLNDVFLILRVKCDVCAHLIGDVQKGDNVLKHIH
jgi:uncharacterized protein with ATP-grasp and redox domains